MKCLTFVICLACIVGTNARGSPPTITVPQSNKRSVAVHYVKIPGPESFPCQAKASPPAKYYWTLNGTRITPIESVISFSESTGALTTGTGFSPAFAGDYQCFAYNDHGTTMTPILTIYAAYATAFDGRLTADVIDVYESEYVKLECKDVPESVPEWIISWRRGTTKTARDPKTFIPIEPSERMIVDKDGSLHILWTEISDEYYYGCVTTNRIFLSTYRSTKIIELRVNQGIKNERRPELQYSTSEVVVYAGKDAELQCIFSYYSKTGEKISIKWLHNGEVIGTGASNLTLTNVQLPTDEQDQSGEYRCEASKTAYGIVNVKIVSPPTFVKGQELLSKSVPVDKDAVFHCGTTSYKTYSVPTVWLLNGVPLLGCPERQFECKTPKADGFSQCIPIKNVCNNDPDCTDGSDEVNCPASCPESQKSCYGQCVPQTNTCEELQCEYPSFMCHNKLKCVAQSMICNQNPDCTDGSDEIACPDGQDVKRNRFYINSKRSQLTLPRVSLTDSMCFQCIARNEYGTTIGEACLTIIDKILVTSGPNSTYNVEPGSRIEIIVEATTDRDWQTQMNYTWQWYHEVTDEKTEETQIVPQTLPPRGSISMRAFYLTNSKNMTIVFPEVKRERDENADENTDLKIYNELINREYTLIIQHRYDKVMINFTINGREILPPPGPVVEAASTNLWFIALILGILLLFIVIILIVCYMYRNRGGTYLLGKKEHQAGHNPEKELMNGFQDVGRVDDDHPKDDQISLSESVKPYDSEDDPTEEYGGDFDVSKFNEEGSFIGAYGSPKSKEATV